MNLPLILGALGVIVLVMLIIMLRWAFISGKLAKRQQQGGIGEGGGMALVIFVVMLLLAMHDLHR